MTNQTITPDTTAPAETTETTETADTTETTAGASSTAAQPTVPLGDKAAFVAAATPAASSTEAPSPTYAPAPTPVGGFSSAPASPSGGVVAGAPAAGAGAGASAAAPQYYPEAPRTNTLGIVTLVLGILGFGLVPVITGHIALGQIKKNREDGYGITLAGLILGYVTLAGWLLVAAFWIGAAGIALFGAFAASAV